MKFWHDPDGIALLLIFCTGGLAFLVVAALVERVVARRQRKTFKRSGVQT